MRMLEILLANVSWRYRGLWYVNKENQSADERLLPDSKRFQIVQLPHGQLLENKLLESVENKLSQQAKARKRTGKDGYTYLLSGILKTHDGIPPLKAE